MTGLVGEGVTCDGCGSRHDGDTPPLTWSLSIEGGHALRLCPDCTRTHLRSMEGKLHPELW